MNNSKLRDVLLQPDDTLLVTMESTYFTHSELIKFLIRREITTECNACVKAHKPITPEGIRDRMYDFIEYFGCELDCTTRELLREEAAE